MRSLPFMPVLAAGMDELGQTGMLRPELLLPNWFSISWNLLGWESGAVLCGKGSRKGTTTRPSA